MRRRLQKLRRRKSAVSWSASQMRYYATVDGLQALLREYGGRFKSLSILGRRLLNSPQIRHLWR